MLAHPLELTAAIGAGVRPTCYSRRRFTATGEVPVGFEVVNAALRYVSTTGQFFWKESPRYGIPAGAPAGSVNARGYLAICVAGRKQYAHRLAWLMHYGVWPSKVIDHINRVKTDNREAFSLVWPVTAAKPGPKPQPTAQQRDAVTIKRKAP